MNTVASLLRDARAIGVDRLDALVLAGHHLARSRAWLMAHDDAPITPAVEAATRAALLERARGVPLAYIVGSKAFHDLVLAVSPAVLVPRPETEALVDWTIELLDREPAAVPAPIVVDLGTGSGAIALASKHARPHTDVHAVDASTEALEVARDNARRLGLTVTFHAGDWWQGDWLAPIDGRIAVAVSNPPYVRLADPHLVALSHEPRAALVSGADGLDAIRAIVASAPRHLAPGAHLLLEHGFDQGDAVRQLLRDAGFDAIETRRDLAGHERCSGGRRCA